MSTPIGQVFNSLAIKAGIAVDNPALKALLASPELATINVDDELVTTIDSGLLSLEAAKNNHPDVKKKYFADAYDGIDKQLMALIATDTFDAADVEEIKLEKSTSKKQELIISKLKAAAKTAKGADKDEINRQLAGAHDAARLAKEEVTTVRNEYEGKIKNIQLEASLSAMFGNYKTIFDDQPAAIKKATMQAIINQALQDKNAEFKIDEQGNMQLLAKDGSNVFGENHVQLTTTSLLDKAFAPILKVANTQTRQQQTTQRQQTPVKTSTTDAERHTEATTDFIKSHADKVIADMGGTGVAMV